ncbi:MAG: type IV pilus biogenesis protein PilM [Janthinobacterium lividum]
MRFFKKARKKDGWLILAVGRDGVAATSIERGAGGKPAVRFAHFLAGQPDAGMLEKAGRDIHAQAYRCATLLGAGEYQVISVEAPNVPQEELRTAIRWRLKDILDFPVDEATVDVLAIPVDAAGARAQQSVFAVAARNGVIKPRQQLFLDAKLDLAVIDIPEMAQRNISATLEPEGRGVAMLSFGPDGGLLTVSFRGELYLSRRVDLGLEPLLDPDHERKHAAFDRITLELQRSLDHFERQFSFISVARLVLAPSEIQGLDDYLSSNLYMPVDTLDLGSVFDFAHAPELADPALQGRFFLPLGAALRTETAA